MKMTLSISIAFLTIAFCSYGQDTAHFKRIPHKMTVLVDNSTVYEEDLDEAPFILPDNTVQLYPGETIYIEVEQEGRKQI